MKVTYDSEADALYFELRPAAPGTLESRPLTDDVVLDYGPDGKVAGIEVLDATEVLGENLEGITLHISPALRKRPA